MTQPPPPYETPSGYPPFQPPPPKKPRPSGWWFVLGGGLIVAAAVAGIWLFVWTLSSFLETDARVPADHQTYNVSVGTDGDRMLWLEDGVGQTCTVAAAASGDPIAQQPVSATYKRSDSDGAWHGESKFAPGDGELQVNCTGGGTILIGPAPQFGSFFLSIALTILIPLGLGLVGLAVLIVTGVLWASRPARPKT